MKRKQRAVVPDMKYLGAGLLALIIVLFLILQKFGDEPLSASTRSLIWFALFCAVLISQRAAWKCAKYWWLVGGYALLIAISVAISNFKPLLWEAGLKYVASVIGFALFWMVFKVVGEAASAHKHETPVGY